MTKEDKELLLKDLCARISCMVKVQVNRVGEWDGETKRFVVSKELTFDDVKSLTENGAVSDIKPYLRPMSSMTEEELKEFVSFTGQSMHRFICATTNTDHWYNVYEEEDWLNSHHFDYRGLIPMGLALPAPDGMYDFK